MVNEHHRPAGSEFEIEQMVGARGFEPPTLSSRTTRATKLRHAPTDALVVQSPGMIANAIGEPPAE
jgi:hypothetical protein